MGYGLSRNITTAATACRRQTPQSLRCVDPGSDLATRTSADRSVAPGTSQDLDLRQRKAEQFKLAGSCRDLTREARNRKKPGVSTDQQNLAGWTPRGEGLGLDGDDAGSSEPCNRKH